MNPVPQLRKSAETDQPNSSELRKNSPLSPPQVPWQMLYDAPASVVKATFKPSGSVLKLPLV